MKRAKDLYPKLISDENLRLAILTVNATHKWHPHHRPNKTVLRVEADIDGYVEKLREIIVNGYCHVKIRQNKRRKFVRNKCLTFSRGKNMQKTIDKLS